MIHRRSESFRAGGDGRSSGNCGFVGHRGRRSSKGRLVGFGRLEIGGVGGQDRIGTFVWRHNDRQVERDWLDRLSSLSVAVGEDKGNVYTRDVQRVEQEASNKIRTTLGFNRYLMRSDNNIGVKELLLIKTQYKL